MAFQKLNPEFKIVSLEMRTNLAEVALDTLPEDSRAHLAASDEISKFSERLSSPRLTRLWVVPGG